MCVYFWQINVKLNYFFTLQNVLGANNGIALYVVNVILYCSMEIKINVILNLSVAITFTYFYTSVLLLLIYLKAQSIKNECTFCNAAISFLKL